MIDAKGAAQAAARFLREVLQSDGVRDVRLEEIEIKENGGAKSIWHVTLSFLRNRPEPGGPQFASPWNASLSSVLRGTEREVKVFEVTTDGEVLGMKQWLMN